MKIPLVLFVACVASLKAASLMDVIECPAECCPTTAQPTTEPATTDPATTDPATTDPATTDPATTDPVTTPQEGREVTTDDSTTTADATTTEDICSVCDQSTCEQGGEGGAGSASLSLLALLLPAVFACLLQHVFCDLELVGMQTKDYMLVILFS